MSGTPIPLPTGSVADGRITASGQIVEYDFQASAGAQVQLATAQSSSPGFTARFTLTDGIGHPVGTWRGTDGNPHPERLTAGGTYKLTVKSNDGVSTGTFSIGLEGISPISPKPLPLVNGGIVSGTIARSLDVKEYVFTAPAGAQVQLATAQSSSPNFTARFTLYDGTGRSVGTWRGTDGNPHPARLTAGGTYLLKVNDNDYNSTGTFSIGLEGISPISPNPLPLVGGGIVSGAIATALDVKEYVFTAPAGAQVQLATTQSSSPGFTARFTLYDGTGRSVGTWRGTDGNPHPARLTAGGTYLLKVNDNDYNSTGTFSIGLEGISPVSPNPLPLKFGVKTSGTIAAALDVKEYVFKAAAGAQVKFVTTQSSSPNFTARFTLYDGTGRSVGTWRGTDGNPHPARLTAGRTYLLKVNDNDYNSTGTFAITLT